MHGYVLAIIAAIPSTVAAWKGISTSRKVDTGNGVKIGEAVYSLHKKVDGLSARLTAVEEKVK